MPLKKNEIISLDITDVTSLGSGIGRYYNDEYPDGFVVFVPLTAKGDSISCKILKVDKNYAFGKIEKINVKSQDRNEDVDCPIYGKCGGCSWRHVSYEAELKYKEQHVKDCIQRIGGLDVEVSPIIGSKEVDRYRNKAQFPVTMGDNGPLIGYFAPRSHRIIDCKDCALQPVLFKEVVDIIRDWISKYKISLYNEKSHKGLIRHIYLRQGKKSHELMICLVSTSKDIPFINELIDSLKHIDNFVSFIINVNSKDTNVILGKKEYVLYGKPYIEDILCDNKISISSSAFYQVNSCQAEILYRTALSEVNFTKEDTVLDIYCGTGTIGLSFAKSVKKVIGIDIVQDAIINAARNAKQNEIENAEFICKDAANINSILNKYDSKDTSIILDPPRKGCDIGLLGIIGKMNLKNIIYISCNPSTLARDLSILSQYNYLTKKIIPVDMFPRTSHVETVALLSKVSE